MEAAYHPAIERERQVFLHESDVDTVLPEHRLAKDLGEKAARVVMANRPWWQDKFPVTISAP